MTIRKLEDTSESVVKSNPGAELRERIVRRAALEFKNGMYGILFFNLKYFISKNIYLASKKFP